MQATLVPQFSKIGSIALVKYLDTYGRDFGINWFKRAIESAL